MVDIIAKANYGFTYAEQAVTVLFQIQHKVAPDKIFTLKLVKYFQTKVSYNLLEVTENELFLI